MGGIAGIIYCDHISTVDNQLVFRMLDVIRHRGSQCKVQPIKPNGVFGTCYFKSDTDNETIAYDNLKKSWLILDGQIYSSNDNGLTTNYSSDAELILKLYRKYGDEFTSKIDGQYAIAIWDETEKRLVLVRDRVGYKPLFYSKLKDVIVFASEIKAILVCDRYEKSVNLRSLNNFLSYGYVPNPDTLFESIFQVKPGHMLIYKDGKTYEKPYWKFTYKVDGFIKPESYYRERFLEVFRNAVSKRLKKHPDSGAFLSGGLDTSAVVAVMHELKNEAFPVFTAGFKEEQYNEVGDAKVVADNFGLDHHFSIIDFNQNFHSLLEKIIWHHDAPFADTSAIPSYFVAKLAKEYVNVVLTGDFPDQLLGGSGHHFKALEHSRHGNFIYRFLRQGIIGHLVTAFHWSAGSNTFLDKLKRMLYREAFPLEQQRIILNMPVPELLKQCLYSTDLFKINKQHNPLSLANCIYQDVKGQDLLNKILYFDMVSYAPDDLNVKVERMTTAHSLKAISPFHDLELVEFALTIPSSLKIKGINGKYIMREALRLMLPEYTLRKKKQGFAMPIQAWLVKKYSNFVREVLLDSRTLGRGYFNNKFLTHMVEAFLKEQTDYASGSEAAIISLITLELWHRMFMDK